jgi:tRNA dimethylallyltransferase
MVEPGTVEPGMVEPGTTGPGGSGPFALVGPTASGKSMLGVLAALELGDVEIVTADSMQVYRGMDIGTAKPALAEREGVPHHLIDVADPSQDWDVAQFVTHARTAIADVSSRGHRALFVGGTGLYMHALIDGLAIPGRWPEVSAELGQVPTDQLYLRLEQLDPRAAGRIDAANRRRVLRALEVAIGSGRPFSSYGPGVGAFPETSWRLAGVWLPRAVIAARIQTRLTKMVEAGFVEEVKALANRPGGVSRTARQALGYREMLAHVEDGADLCQAIELAVRRTRQFARRQRMWWRRDPRVRWFGAAENPLAILPALLGDWRR